jgi:hypothetical protein
MTGNRENRFLAPGTKVRLDLSGDDGTATAEYGVVVHCWDEPAIGFDCYVAFFGDTPPSGAPSQKPYVLKYASSSLTSIT